MRELLLLVLLLLSACGAREPLQPAPGKALPVKPYGASTTPNATQLLQAPFQSRPVRNDEVLQNSVQRRSDEFNLPPE